MSLESVNAIETPIFSPVSDQPFSLPTWIDENTGRRVWQVTNNPEGAGVGYFRNYST